MVEKYWYCEKCGKFPEKVIEVFDWAKEIRVWDGELYAIEDSDYGGCQDLCGECETQLIEKESDVK